jgi:hypothetical protein
MNMVSIEPISRIVNVQPFSNKIDIQPFFNKVDIEVVRIHTDYYFMTYSQTTSEHKEV